MLEVLFQARSFQGSRLLTVIAEQPSDLQRLLGGLSLLEKYSPVSTLPISTKSRSTTDPSKYPKAGPNTAMAKRMAEKKQQRDFV